MKAASEMEPFTLTFVEILLPKLKRFGVSDEAIRTILVEDLRRFFEGG
jgi:predicted metal-dependent phosphotriesterase family hydrolase